jgi:ferredoxin/flavodoxin---NADP+ reductase
MQSRYSKIPARLDSRIELSDGLAIFRFSLERDFSFIPGQYATLWLTHRGKTLGRPYSIASSPYETRTLEFYINLVKEGQLTPSLWEPEVIEGLIRRDPETKAAIMGPSGRFVLDSEDPRDLVFVSSGTGLAPFISMIRKLERDLRTHKDFLNRRICLIHGVSYPNHLGYRDELEALAALSTADLKRKLPLIYLPTISRPFIDSTWMGLKGRAESLFDLSSLQKNGPPELEDTIKKLLHHMIWPQTHAVYICGHPGTIDNVVAALSRKGFHLESDLKREKYYP